MSTTRHSGGLGVRLSGAVLLCYLAMTGAYARAEQPLDLARYRGKVVLVDFWASWCAPCRQSFPWLNDLHSKYAHEGLVILGVNVDQERAAADRFLKDVPARFEIIYDPQGELATKYKLMGMPSSFVFGPNGELVSSHVGFKQATRAAREAEIVTLLERDIQAAR